MRSYVLAAGICAALAAPAIAQTPAPQGLAYDQPPVLLDRDSVVARLHTLYPPALRDARVGGTPLVRFTVRTDGTTADATVERPSPHPALDSAALAVVGGMRFTPAKHQGRDIDATVSLPVAFTPPEAVAAADAAPSAPGVVEKPDEEPRLLNAREIGELLVQEYPPLLMGPSEGMRVVLRIRVSAEGRPLEIQVKESGGNPSFERALLHVAQRMRFRAARLRGQPVEAWTEVGPGIVLTVTTTITRPISGGRP